MKLLFYITLIILANNHAPLKASEIFVPEWDAGISTNNKPSAVRGFAIEAVSRNNEVGLSLAAGGSFGLIDLQKRCVLPTRLINYGALQIQNPGASIAEEDRRWISGYFFKGKTPCAIVNGQSGESYISRVQAEIWDLDYTNSILKLGMSRKEFGDFIQHQKFDKNDDGMDAFFTNIFPEKINYCEVLPDKKTLIVCSGGDESWNEIINSLSAWNLETGKSVQIFKGAHGAVYDFSLNRDGSKILAGGFDLDAYIWDTRSGKLLATLPRGKTIPKGMETTWGIYKVALSENSRYAAAASGSGWVFVWDVANQKLIDSQIRFENAPFINWPPLIAFSPKGNILAVAKGNKVFLYSIPKLQLVKDFDGKQQYPTKMIFLDDNTLAVSSVEGPEGVITRFWTIQN